MNWRPASRDDRTLAALWAGTIVASLALRPVWLSLAPLLPRCAWHAWTGLPCPGCGATRAMTHLLHLDLAGALRYNPLATVAACAFAAAGIAAPGLIALLRRVPVVPPGPKPRLLVAAGILVGANWTWLVCSGV